ncbi:MAB_1171c family putative transporter [Streptomyces noursei]|uniref:MAB_1171c family putative transporter n=1 Tax=Streptomyces noursei TaxID=1971 RepID=UPI00045EEEEC|nr:MAB_1171c family putative transporter [Streptomyces noursei]AIA03485.1 integral membrane protein [Streptomyces noursei]
MNAFLYPIVAAVSIAALIFKVWTLRNDRSPTHVALAVSFFFTSVIFTVSIPSVWPVVSEASGIVNFSGLLTQTCVITSAMAQQTVLLHLTYERKTAWRKAIRRICILTVVVILMVVLFLQASSLGERPDDFALTKARYYPAYMLIYIIAHGCNQIDIARLAGRHAKVAPSPWLRRGLRLVAVSGWFSILYVSCRGADIVAGQFNYSGHPWEPLAQLATTCTTLPKTIGWTMPDWGRHITAAWEAMNRRVAHRQLSRLHQSLTNEVPDPVLPLDSGTDLRTRLYRLVVEIRDAQWALRMWMRPEVAAEARQRGEAAGLTGDDLAAAVEASQLQAAITERRKGNPPTDHPAHPRYAEPEDLAAEIEFQRRLARAFYSAGTRADELENAT